MTNTIEGEIINIGDIQEFSSGFSKKEVVVRTSERYPQLIPIDFTKDNISKLDGLNVGDRVSCSYNIRSSEYKGRYYINFVGWKIQKAEADSEPPPSISLGDVDGEDVPF